MAHSQGDLKKAEAHHRNALTLREKVLGPDHPQVASSLYNLGIVVAAQKQHTEAEAFFQRALTILGSAGLEDHPVAVLCVQNFAAMLRELGREGEAVALESRATS